MVIHGKATRGNDGRLEIVHPEVQLPDQDQTQALQPLYRLGDYIGQRLARTAINHALSAAEDLPAALPAELRGGIGFPSIAQAVRYLHQPPADANLDALRNATTPAHQALAIDELFAFELALEIDRERARRRPAIAFDGDAGLPDRFASGLPFELTAAQRRAIDEIRTDMAQPLKRHAFFARYRSIWTLTRRSTTNDSYGTPSCWQT